MGEASTVLRPGRREDAVVLAELVNDAGEGLPLYLWSKLASPGQTGWDMGRTRAAREEGSFSYRNAMMIEYEGSAVACLIGYAIADAATPISPEMPAMFVPLQELENQVPGTWYVNVLAVLPAHRNRGFGSDLLDFADLTGRRLARRGMSVIVSDANDGARRLYERHGYRALDRRKMIKEDWINEGDEWVLLTKPL